MKSEGLEAAEIVEVKATMAHQLMDTMHSKEKYLSLHLIP